MGRAPHIVVFNPDHWRGDVLGHVGNPAAVTPNLDRLVLEDAVSFTKAFCQNPGCTPSRCSFMTGWYPHVRGHRTMYHMLHAERGEPNLLRILRQNGYFVWSTARNDLLPAQFGFDRDADVWFFPRKADYRRWKHTPRPGPLFAADWRGKPDGDAYYSFYAGKLNKGRDSIYADLDWGWVLGAAEFIREYKGENPLFLFLSLSYPHPPYGVEEPWFSRIDRERLPRRLPAPPDAAGKSEMLKGIRHKLNMQGWSEERWNELRAVYYGMCARTDHQLGLILEALRDAGIYRDTAVFFFSDHGDFTGDYGLVEKSQNTFEDCLVRVPLVIKPPANIDAVRGLCDALVELVDFPATVFDLAGIEPGYDHFGRSLLYLIEGDTEEHRDAVFCEGGRLLGEGQAMEIESLEGLKRPEESPYWPRLSLQVSDDMPWHGKAAMCRDRTHKYVKRLYEKDELYDLERDPNELNNVIGEPGYAETLARLKERMADWYMETCDVVPEERDRRW